jgi:hypothetical protein
LIAAAIVVKEAGLMGPVFFVSGGALARQCLPR